MRPHPASELFPPMTAAELDELAEDIRAHGLLDPIVLLDGLILDGRNRLRACEMVGFEPRFVEWEPSGVTPLEWVVSHNLKRRNLTIAQRAAIALDLLPMLEAEAKERQREGQIKGAHTPTGESLVRERTEDSRATAKAAEMVGIGRTSVEHAKAIAKREGGPEIIQQMRAGEIATVQGGLLEAGYERADRPVNDDPSVWYGKGDKFREATGPLARYLRAWGKRDYRFANVNKSDAKRRLRIIDELSAGLEKCRADLSVRAESWPHEQSLGK